MASTSSTPLDLILIGKPGSGKSATGNSIVREPDQFKIIHNTTSEEKYPQYRLTRYDNRDIQVVECPGIIDTDTTTTEGIESVVRAILNSVLVNPQGYHALLIVVKFNQTFLSEDLESLRILKTIFGENVIKSHGVIVMCQGDCFFPSNRDAENLTFEKFCEQAAGPFKELLDECNQRIVLFDNVTKHNFAKIKQLDNLLKAIDELDINRTRYTTHLFQKAVEFTKSINTKKETLFEQKRILISINNIKIVYNQNIIQDLFKLRKALKQLNEISQEKKNIEKKVQCIQRLISQMNKLLESNKNIKYEENFKEINREIISLNKLFREMKHETDVGYFHVCSFLIGEKDCNYIEEIVEEVKRKLKSYNKPLINEDHSDMSVFEEEGQQSDDVNTKDLSINNCSSDPGAGVHMTTIIERSAKSTITIVRENPVIRGRKSEKPTRGSQSSPKRTFKPFLFPKK